MISEWIRVMAAVGRRRAALAGALAVAMVAAAPARPAAAAHRQITTNDGVTLEAPAAEPDGLPAVAPVESPSERLADHDESAARRAGKAVGAAAEHMAPTDSPPPAAPALEAKSLGRPANGHRSPALDGPAAAQRGFLTGLDPRRNEITRVGGALAVVLGLLLLARTVLRRTGLLWMQRDRPSGVLEILARYPVARGQHLVLLKLARRIILIHQSGSTMTPLTSVTDADEVAGLLGRMEAGAGARGAARFRAAMQEFQSEHDALLARMSGPRRDQRRGRAELVDLTRGQGWNFARWLGRRTQAGATGGTAA